MPRLTARSMFSLGHVDGLGGLDGGAEPDVGVRVAAPALRGQDDFLGDAGEDLALLRVDEGLLVFDACPVGVAGHVVPPDAGGRWNADRRRTTEDGRQIRSEKRGQLSIGNRQLKILKRSSRLRRFLGGWWRIFAGRVNFLGLGSGVFGAVSGLGG